MAVRRYTPSDRQLAGGDGQFEFEDSKPVAASAFLVTDLGPGQGVRLQADVPALQRLVPTLPPKRLPTRFVGRTDNGWTVAVEQPFVFEELCAPNGLSPFQVTWQSLGRMTIKEPDASYRRDDLLWRAELLNVVFEGERPGTGREVHFVFGGRRLRLAKAVSYESLLSDLRADDEQFAATACLEIEGSLEDLGDPASVPGTGILAMVQDFCDLLTLASGAHVIWHYFDVLRLSDGQWLTRQRSPQLVHRYSGGAGMIDRREGKDLRRFMESAHQPFLERRESFDFPTIVQAYVGAEGSSFIDSRTLLMAVLGEFLAKKAIDERAGPKQRLIQKGVGKKIRAVLGGRLRELLLSEQTLQDSDLILRSAERNLATILSPKLRDSLRIASDYLGAGLTNDDLERFVDIRNDLAHGLKLNAERGNKGRQYFDVWYVVDRLILGALGYQGPFVDCRAMQRAMFGETAAHCEDVLE
jgi:hypothetical protein